MTCCGIGARVEFPIGFWEIGHEAYGFIFLAVGIPNNFYRSERVGIWRLGGLMLLGVCSSAAVLAFLHHYSFM